MAIKISKDKIVFRNFSITNTADGIYVDGTFTANGQFVDATQAQGSVSGFASGGAASGTSPFLNQIQQFSLVSDGNATDTGDITFARAFVTGSSSSTHGYTLGGYGGAPVDTNIIDKFPFASPSDGASDVGNLSNAMQQGAGHESTENGYNSGGDVGGGPPSRTTNIDKFPFASDTNATTNADLITERSAASGVSSTTHGYTCGGFNSTPSPANKNEIEKFPFASDNNATDVGDLTAARQQGTGHQSSTHGYTLLGGDYCDKFSFASDNNAGREFITPIGFLEAAAISSTTFGFTAGGLDPGPTATDTIQKFQFDNESGMSDVGNLAVTSERCGGTQV